MLELFLPIYRIQGVTIISVRSIRSYFLDKEYKIIKVVFPNPIAKL